MKFIALCLALFAVAFAAEDEDTNAGQSVPFASTTIASTAAPEVTTTAFFKQTPFAFASRNDDGRYNPFTGTYDPYNRFNNNAFGRYNAFPNRYNNFGRSNNQFRNYNDYIQQQQAQKAAYSPFTTTEAPSTADGSSNEEENPASRLAAYARASAQAGRYYPGSTIPPVLVPRSNLNDYAANIVKYSNEINPDGSFSYYYENDNGIAAQARGIPKTFAGNPPVSPVVHEGSFTWTSPEGKVVTITYVADENGYQPQGDAIPTPPPVPELIARSIAYNLRNAPVNVSQ